MDRITTSRLNHPLLEGSADALGQSGDRDPVPSSMIASSAYDVEVSWLRVELSKAPSQRNPFELIYHSFICTSLAD